MRKRRPSRAKNSLIVKLWSGGERVSVDVHYERAQSRPLRSAGQHEGTQMVSKMIAKHSSPLSAGIACVHRDSREGMDGIRGHPKNRIRQAHDEDQGLAADGVKQA